LNRSGAQTTTTSTQSNPSATTAIPHTPLNQESTNDFETTQSVDLSRFLQREDSTRFLSIQDLTSSPQLAISTMQGLYTSQQTINKTNTLATSQIDPSFSILDRLVQSGRHEIPQPGEYDWLYYPYNEGGFHQYPDIDRTSPYGLLTLEMCEVAKSG
jgi:hypothetical protein